MSKLMHFSKEDLLDQDIWKTVIAEKDPVIRQHVISEMETRAKELNIYTQVADLKKAYLADEKKQLGGGETLPDFIEICGRRPTVNPALLAEAVRRECVLLSVKGQRENSLYLYEHGVYTLLTDVSLQTLVKSFIIGYDRSLLKMRDVYDAARDLRSDPPAVTESELNTCEDMINFRNGLYSISEGRLLPHSPSVLSTIQLPLDYEPENDACYATTEYLYRLADHDTELFDLLLEIAGVCISNIFGYRLKATPILYGPGDSGKSQFVLLLQHLLGSENCASGSLADLEQRFGTNALYQKRLYSDADMAFMTIEQLSVFKSLTGGDSIKIEYKGKDCFTSVFRGMLIFCANELPHFGGDKGEWVYKRIILIPCGGSIPESCQDKHLQQKLRAEAGAFVSTMVIPALRRVVSRGYKLTEPAASRRAEGSYLVENSPVREFFTSFCSVEGEPVRTRVFISAFNAWYSAEHGGRRSGLSSRAINKELCRHLDISAEKLVVRRKKGDCYCFGISSEGFEYLKQETVKPENNGSGVKSVKTV